KERVTTKLNVDNMQIKWKKKLQLYSKGYKHTACTHVTAKLVFPASVHKWQRNHRVIGEMERANMMGPCESITSDESKYVSPQMKINFSA
ncbi:hypothetical protein RUM43_003467, partial [Polyplax serrata]